MRVCEAPFGEPIARPPRRLYVGGGRGQPCPDFVGERPIQRQRPGALQPLRPDSGDHVAAGAVLRGWKRRAERQQQCDGGKQKVTHH